MASPWQQPPNSMPAAGEIVWVRIWSNYGPPFQAKWDLGSQTFTDQTGSGLVFPWWIVARWKPVG